MRQDKSSYQSQTKDAMRALVQLLMDVEVSQMVSANRYERNPSRRAYRNGYRTSLWETPIGQIELRIPKLRRGTYYPHRLLNDNDVIDGLIALVRQCIHRGVDIPDVQHTMNAVSLLKLSTYELHQICEALRPYAGNSTVTPASNKYRHPSHLPDNVEVVVQKRDEDGQLQIFSQTQVNLDDEQFWREFTRRMQQNGKNVEDYQSVLSAINPYAVMNATSIIYPNEFDMFSYSTYIHQHKLTA